MCSTARISALLGPQGAPDAPGAPDGGEDAPDTLAGFLGAPVAPCGPDGGEDAGDTSGAPDDEQSAGNQRASWLFLAVQAVRRDGLEALHRVTDKRANSYSRNGTPAEVRAARYEAKREAERLNLDALHAIGHRGATADADGLRRALFDLGFVIRFNVRTHRIEYMDGMSGPWRDLDGITESVWRETIAERFYESRERLVLGWGHTLAEPDKWTLSVEKERSLTLTVKPLRWTDGRWRTSLQATANLERVEPLRDWLSEDLPEWDEIERLHFLLDESFHLEDDPDNLDRAAWVSRFLFLGPIARTFEPGHKIDETPILVGPQGIGKSTLLEIIFPDHIPGLFNAGFPVLGSRQEQAEAMTGCAMVELEEMHGVSRAELSRLKATITRTDDRVRLAYRHDPEPLPRTAVFVGTTNDPEPLPNDPTGNRRWVVVGIRGADHPEEPWLSTAAWVREYVGRHRLQLWAEAMHLWRAGTRPSLPESMKAAQRRDNEERRAPDVTDDLLATADPTFFDKPRILPEIADHVGFDVAGDRRREARLSKALSNAGFVRKRRRLEGVRAWRWFRPLRKVADIL